MRTIAYIDGGNLYYGLLRGHPEYKWLDLVSLARNLLDAKPSQAARTLALPVRRQTAQWRRGKRRMKISKRRMTKQQTPHVQNKTPHEETA